MWIFGRSSKKEIKAIKKQGWKVTEVDDRHFDLCLDPNASLQKFDPAQKKIYAVWVDRDMIDLLLQWHNEEKAQEKAKHTSELCDLRRVIAEKLWDETDLGKGIEVLDCDGWEADGDVYIRKFVYEDHEQIQNDLRPSCTRHASATFTVAFKPDTAKPVNKGNLNW